MKASQITAVLFATFATIVSGSISQPGQQQTQKGWLTGCSESVRLGPNILSR
jgi:hypothetical protein